MIAVADASPLCYLVLIGRVELLPTLFGDVLIPQSVRDELADEDAPEAVRTWIAAPPGWLEIRSVEGDTDASLQRLHTGERDAIRLAESVKADLIILDDKAARRVATERGLNVTGLLGVLGESATRGLVDLPEVVDRLRQTTFRASLRLLKSLLDRHKDID
ncbi:MAG TPA: DUF3368 domain-containing protein [Blastocatellia bacterium]|nr:DUF3368 domain-containing protein [Blastocatellia bacterium]